MNKITLVDSDKVATLSKTNWSIHQTRAGCYARGCVNGKRIYLHRYLLDCGTIEVLVDHINHNTLDNRLSNLRLCTKAENTITQFESKNNRSGHKGVSWYKPLKKWRAYIGQGYKQVHLGYFYDTLEEAVAKLILKRPPHCMENSRMRNIWVCVFDLHYPHVHKPTLDATLDFIRRNKAKVASFLFGGDQFDNAEISHHTKGKPLLGPPGSYKKNTVGFNNNVLEPLEKYPRKEADRVWIEGNHDYWCNQLLERQPEFVGTLERPLLLGLEDRGWEVVGLGESKRLGKLLTVHGEGLTGIGNQASVYHAKRAVESFCSSVLYGHLHSAQSYTKVLPHSTKDKWIGYCAPAACTLNPSYLQNRPTAWVNGIVIVELHEPEKPNSNFNVYPIIVSDGKFCFGGETYGK